MNNKNNNLNFHFLILFLLINCSLAKILKHKSSKTFLESKQQPDIHRMVIFGNTGEIDYFKNSTLFSEKMNQAEKEDFYEKNIFTQKYHTNKLSCLVNDKDSNSHINLLNEKGLTNFEKVLYDQEVLGFIRKANEVLFLGEIIIPEYQELVYKKKAKTNSDNTSFFESRIRCGWNIFLNALKNAKLAKITTNEEKIENIAISDKIKFNKGRYSQSINRDLEDNFISSFSIFTDEKIGPEGETKAEGFVNSEKMSALNITNSNGFNKFALKKSPILINVVYQDFTLQIVDFDSNILSCLKTDNEADFNVCIKKWTFTNLTFQEATIYALKLNEILTKKILQNQENKKVWKVMRAHHPPLFYSRKSNRFYFQNITATNNKGEQITFNLWDSIKQSLINAFFASLDNNASVNIIPYSISDFVDVKFNCFKKKYEDVGCYYYPEKNAGSEIDYSKAPLTKKFCDNNLFYKLPFKANTNKAEESFLYVFNVGNSGASLEKLEYGLVTNAHLFWARVQKDNDLKQFIHGVTYVRFTKDFIEVDFMETEVNDENKSTKTYKSATFRITESHIPDQVNFNQYIKKSVCKDYLVVGRSGSI